MAQTITGITEIKSVIDLDTYNHTVKTAGMYVVDCVVSDIPPSGVIITIQKNGSTVATSTAPAATQGTTGLRRVINCAVADVLTVILSSSTASDTGKNRIKATLNIHVGSA